MPIHPIARAALVALVALGAAAPAFAGDIIRKKDGTFFPQVAGSEPTAAEFAASTVTFVDADESKVTYRLGTVPQLQSYKASDVEELYLDPSTFPQAWRDAEGDLLGGAYEAAMNRFLALGTDRGLNRIQQQKSFHNAVRAAAGTGNPANMRNAVAAMDKAFPQSFYRRHARETMLQAFIDAGDMEAALSMATELESIPGLGESDKVKITLLRARVAFRAAMASKDKAALRKAQEQFQSIASATNGKAGLLSVNLIARLGYAQATLALGDTGPAKTEFDAIIKAATAPGVARDPSVLAAAYNGLGEIWFQQGDRAGWIEARRCFLRVTCLFADGPAAEDLAKALYHTGACFFRLQDTPNWWADGQKELSECQVRFPKTHWGQQAVLLRQQTPKPK